MATKKEKIQEHFTSGFEIGFGIGCIVTFIVLWISLFFGSRMTSEVKYESIIAVFIYPLLFLVIIGTVFLTAGAVKHLDSRKTKMHSSTDEGSKEVIRLMKKQRFSRRVLLNVQELYLK